MKLRIILLLAMSLLAQPVLAKSSNFFEKVIEVCTAHSCSITSWIRSPEHNARVGGVPTSKHLTGLAVDAVLDSEDYEAFAEDARSLGLKAIVYDDHVHLEKIDAIRTDNDAGLNPDRGHPQDLGNESEGKSRESSSNPTGTELPSQGSQRSKRLESTRDTVHTESHSDLRRVCDYRVAEVCATRRHTHSSRLDRIQSGLLVDGRKRYYNVAGFRRPCPYPPRHTFGISDRWSVLRGQLSRRWS